MLAQSNLRLPISKALTLEAMRGIAGRDIATIATEATSSGEALLERSGLLQLDEASHCHFGAQLGRPFTEDSVTTLQLRWWNDRARSLTPGFIGQLRVRTADDDTAEVAVSGEYHPRAYLYELADRRLLSRMARAVVSDFLERLVTRIKASVVITAA